MNNSTPEFKKKVAAELAEFAEYDAGERGATAELLCALANSKDVLSEEFTEALFWEMSKFVETYQTYCKIEKRPDGTTNLVIFEAHQ